MNLDSEDEGELYIGCAGGLNTNVIFHYTETPVPSDTDAFKINIAGLKGGHSGLDIALGRGNSTIILNRILWFATRNFDLRLALIDGGSLRNAIPREAFAVVTVPRAKSAEFLKYVEAFSDVVKEELSAAEPDLKIEAVAEDMPDALMDEKTQINLINALCGCVNGVMGMCADMPEVVETSTNLAIVKSEDGTIEVATLQRSSVDSLIEDIGNKVRSVFELAGAEVEHSGQYPGWKPNVQSSILNTMKNVYKDNFGKLPEVKVIHAGLECGLLGGVYPNLDMISFGPTIRNPHSPDEKVNIETVEKFWEFLVVTLENIPEK